MANFVNVTQRNSFESIERWWIKFAEYRIIDRPSNFFSIISIIDNTWSSCPRYISNNDQNIHSSRKNKPNHTKRKKERQTYVLLNKKLHIGRWNKTRRILMANRINWFTLRAVNMLHNDHKTFQSIPHQKIWNISICYNERSLRFYTYQYYQ